MAGRGRIPRHQELHDFRGGLPPPQRRGHVPVAINPLEEEIVIRHDEIRRLHADNHLLVEENVALRRGVVAIKEELHASGQLITRIRADKEAQVREFIQKAQKLEADARGLESAGPSFYS
ncbi:hypothetical protein HPP92_005882 [Vanilla planifolia]|uniref:Uncharacterized protein n=1 Tax=Vanilla planifolia TaxID=51239 RepID=A0A835V9Q8_VANPL|nr:hypothetical protein HPP92_006142 [Vanilla planifolia]KAG0494888.1 hypothetical protein HPP92_005882 [Vanilla planifolia]